MGWAERHPNWQWIAERLNLPPEEPIRYVSHRHWIVLFQRGFIFFAVGLLAAGIALYRLAGGQFIVGGAEAAGQMDIFNWFLLVLIGAILVIAWATRRGKKKRSAIITVLYLLLVSILALALLFRLQGGRLFAIDPLRSGGGDAVNLSLFILALIMLLVIVYIYIDWANDFLVLTDERVIYEDRQEIPFVGTVLSNVRQQMSIEDIQQVNLRQESYFEYWAYQLFGRFGFERYGTLIVRSYSPRTLTFTFADDPNTMQKRIMDKVRKLRAEEGTKMLQDLIESQVYDQKPPPPPKRALKVESKKAPFFTNLFPRNPEIRDDANETIIWKPSWIYVTLRMSQPLLVLLLTPIGFALLAQLGLISSTVAFLLWVPVAIISVARIWWINEEYKHDMYILTREDISDIDKRPFGPENRRRAPLGAVQDISFNINFFENLLGYGDVIIQTGGAVGGDFMFRHVPDPRGVQAELNDYLVEFRKREQEKPFNDAIKLLRAYHTAQLNHGEVLDKEALMAEISEQLGSNGTDPGDLREQVAQDILINMHAQMRREARIAARTELWRALRGRGRRRPSSGS